MYTSPILISFLLSLLTIVTATPPACLLAAINNQPNPSDLKSICGSLESSVAGNITEICTGDALTGAISAYEATCLSSEGVTISITSSTSSSSKSGSASVSATTTGSGNAVKITGSAGATGSAASAGSGSSTATASGGAASASATGSGAEGLIVPGLLGMVGMVGVVLL